MSVSFIVYLFDKRMQCRHMRRKTGEEGMENEREKGNWQRPFVTMFKC